MATTRSQPPNPRRQAAGRRNRALRGPLSEDGRARLRAAALQHQPWLRARLPATEANRRATRAGSSRPQSQPTVREVRADLAAVRRLIGDLRRLRGELLSG